MDIYDQITYYLDDVEAEFIKTLSEYADQTAEARRLEGMLAERFPTLPEGIEHRRIAEQEMRRILELLRDRPVALSVTNSPSTTLNATVAETPAPKKKKKRAQTLNFRFIQDDALKLSDRIVFSYLCRLAKLDKAAELHRIRKYTGYRPQTILNALSKLSELGYVGTDSKPLKSFPGVLVHRNSDDANVVRAVVRRNQKGGRIIRAGWAVKAFGISRRTYYRYMSKVTDGTQ